MNTEILVIVDRSGSMNVIRDAVVSGFNSFLKEQQAVPGAARVTFTQFDDVYEVLFTGVDIQHVLPLTPENFTPRGYTALYDAIGRTLTEQGQRIKTQAWADLVIVCIMTDGVENASREYTLARIREMTAHAEKHGWKFVYIAANQDAFAASQVLGMAAATTANFAANASGTQAAYATMSTTTRSLRTGGNA